jgi:hypothetical protein
MEVPFLPPVSAGLFWCLVFGALLGTAQPSTLESAVYSALKRAFEFVEEAPKSSRNAVVPARGADVAWLRRDATHPSSGLPAQPGNCDEKPATSIKYFSTPQLFKPDSHGKQLFKPDSHGKRSASDVS